MSKGTATEEDARRCRRVSAASDSEVGARLGAVSILFPVAYAVFFSLGMEWGLDFVFFTRLSFFPSRLGWGAWVGGKSGRCFQDPLLQIAPLHFLFLSSFFPSIPTPLSFNHTSLLD